MKADALEALSAARDEIGRLEAVCARVLAGDKEKKMLIAGLTRAIEHAQSAKRLLAMLASGEAAGLSKEGSETP